MIGNTVLVSAGIVVKLVLKSTNGMVANALNAIRYEMNSTIGTDVNVSVAGGCEISSTNGMVANVLNAIRYEMNNTTGEVSNVNGVVKVFHVLYVVAQ